MSWKIDIISPGYIVIEEYKKKYIRILLIVKVLQIAVKKLQKFVCIRYKFMTSFTFLLFNYTLSTKFV